MSHDWDCAASKSSRLRDPCDDIRAAVDEELRRLAEKYRTAVVLCDLEGKTRKEVTRQLGLAEGIVASRLARGRSILAKRLARRGFAGVVVAAVLVGVPTSIRLKIHRAQFPLPDGILVGAA